QRPVLVIEDLSKAHWPADHYRFMETGQFEIVFGNAETVSSLLSPKVFLRRRILPPSTGTIFQWSPAFLQLGLF
ncbi:hypothetical protein KFU94_60685, partial [Chloroflexi bacterium TSY]|nr:hypothetical protein [Chloroflexi bacterium TSY]